MRLLLIGGTAAAAAAALVLAAARRRRRKKVVITGGCGNLGGKLARHLLKSPDEWSVVLIEHPNFFHADRVAAGASVVLGDCEDGTGEWTEAMRGADAVVHFSAVNPYPNASFAESAGSMAHSFNVFLAARKHGVRRVVLASSNHVMGQYKEKRAHPKVRPTDPAACGTPLRNKADLAASGDAVAYSVAKLAGEQLERALAAVDPGRTSFFALRIGWCQPGENSPRTLSAAGVPPEFQTQGADGGNATGMASAEDVDGDWFKGMWLSNGDFVRYFEAAIRAPSPTDGRAVIVNAMSNNSGMRWSLEETRKELGVIGQDDSRRAD